ncbi:hypothetical protein ACLB2K_024602 [Fragaria x ananassa]
MFEKWGRILCEDMIIGSQKFYCPFKDCSAMLIDDGAEAVRESECPNCKRLFCAQCKVPWHAQLTCSQFKRRSKNDPEKEDIMMEKLAFKKHWRKCPWHRRASSPESGLSPPSPPRQHLSQQLIRSLSQSSTSSQSRKMKGLFKSKPRTPADVVRQTRDLLIYAQRGGTDSREGKREEKLFAANQNKPADIVGILVANRSKLLRLFADFKIDKEDEQFEADKAQVVREIAALEPKE